MAIIGILFWKLNNNKQRSIDDKNLYDLAVQYLINNDSNSEKFNDAYKSFIDYSGFGIREDNQYRYAYMWILEESYYLENNKIIFSSGSSMAYKFIFNKDNDELIKYELPMDGSYYVSSIKKMFPRDIARDILSFSKSKNRPSSDNLRKQVKEHFSYLEDTNIYVAN